MYKAGLVITDLDLVPALRRPYQRQTLSVLQPANGFRVRIGRAADVDIAFDGVGGNDGVAHGQRWHTKQHDCQYQNTFHGGNPQLVGLFYHTRCNAVAGAGLTGKGWCGLTEPEPF